MIQGGEEASCLYIGLFPQKSPAICGSFAERDLQLKAAHALSAPCMMSDSCDMM